MEGTEGDVEVKVSSNIIPSEPIPDLNGKSKLIWKLIPIILIVLVTIGLIIYFTEFYIPDIKEVVYNESFEEGYLTGQFDALNDSQYYTLGLNRGYILGQEEIIIRINSKLEIPAMLFDQDGNFTELRWTTLQQICNPGGI